MANGLLHYFYFLFAECKSHFLDLDSDFTVDVGLGGQFGNAKGFHELDELDFHH